MALSVALVACLASTGSGILERPRSSPDGAQPARARFSANLVREVVPFPVADATGQPYALPFLGGLNVPRPQFVDIDADGDLDLFVQEFANVLWFFENTGTARAPRYEFRSDHYQGISIGEWFRFADIDGDGDLDLLGEELYSHIRYVRNEGTPREARFAATSDSLRDAAGVAIFADRQNIPGIVDFDCDGRLDLFIGRVTGTIARYEATAPGSPNFAFIEENFEGIEIIGQIDTTGTRHGANSMAFADFDNDGDLDLFWGDFFERGVLFIENTGRSCSSPFLQNEPVWVPFADSLGTSGYNAPAPVDIDGDGDIDFLMGVLGGAFNPVASAADNFYFWERTAEDRLELRTRRFLGTIDLGGDTAPAAGDLDGDGDLDILIGTRIDPSQADAGRLVLLRNDGSATAPAFRIADTLRIVDAYNLAPALGDLDGDGDLDLIVGSWNKDLFYFRNEGTPREPRFVEDTSLAIRPPRVSNAVPALVDIDSDGDLDLFVGEAAGEFNFYRNEGTTRQPRFVLVSDRLDDMDVGRRSAPAMVDFNGDGLIDIVSGREEGGTVVYRNTGTLAQPRFQVDSSLSIRLPILAAPLFADFTGDGVLDLVAGTASGGLVFLRGG